jgi:MYXO-CTERM domain-containing protein
MIRSLSAISISLLACTAANAGFWTVSNNGQNDFYTVADAMGDGRVQNGDTIQILSGTYAGFDTGDLAITIEPGNSPGIVNLTGNSRIRASSGVNFEISGLNSGLNGGAVEFDQMIVTGNMSFEGTLGIRLTGGFTPSYGDSFALVQTGGTLTFTGQTNLPTLAGGLNWNIAVVSGSSQFGSAGYSLVASVVPAPGAAALVGLAGLITGRRRRN